MNEFCIVFEDVFITTFNAEAMCPKIIISVEGLDFVMTVIVYFTQKKIKLADETTAISC